MNKKPFSVKDRLRSFRYAFNGLKFLWNDEHNFRIHLVLAACVILAGIALSISLNEWIAIAFAVGVVMITEALNTSIELVADFASPDYDQRIKKIKDISAAAVLIVSMMAVVVGALIFIPKIIALCCLN